MSNTALRSALDALAHSFAHGVLAAIRGASIEDLLAESGRSAARRGPGRPAGPTPAAIAARAISPARAASPAKVTKGGRLARRSAEQIAAEVDRVVALVKKIKGGMRSEEIKKTLNLGVREVPRILKTGLASKKLKSKGHKRATVYSAA